MHVESAIISVMSSNTQATYHFQMKQIFIGYFLSFFLDRSHDYNSVKEPRKYPNKNIISPKKRYDA